MFVFSLCRRVFWKLAFRTAGKTVLYTSISALGHRGRNVRCERAGFSLLLMPHYLWDRQMDRRADTRPMLYTLRAQRGHCGFVNDVAMTTMLRSLKDTTRDAILTCARKPTRVSLIYRTKPSTKKWEEEELKREKRISSDVSVNSPRGIPGVSP